jgi:hypothetical protein
MMNARGPSPVSEAFDAPSRFRAGPRETER